MAENITKRMFSRLRNIFGLDSDTTDLTQLGSPGMAELNSAMGTFNESELNLLPGNTIADRKRRTRGETTIEGMVTELFGTSASVRKIKESATNSMIMAPEIKIASEVYSTSILSPNDQDSTHTDIVSESEMLTENTNDAISKYFTDFFNTQYYFGKKLKKDVVKCLFGAGAACRLLLPKRNLRLLAQAVEDDPHSNLGLEGWQGLTDEELELQFAAATEQQLGFEGLYDSSNSAEQALDTELLCDIEDSVRLGLEGDNTIQDMDKTNFSTVVKSLSLTMFKNLKKEGSSYLVTSKDVGAIRDSHDKTRKKVKDQQKEYLECFIGGSQSKVLCVSDNNKLDKEDVAAVIDFPAHAVIPVCSPSNKDIHFGYWLLLDQWNNPINTEITNFASDNDSARLDQLNARAFMGDNVPEAVNNINSRQKFNIASSIFGVALSKMLEHRMSDMGIHNVDLPKSNAISSAILHNVIFKRKVKMVYVPEPLMMYYRFDHRADGTGKSLIEDLMFMVSLRTTLIMANILGAMDNAVRKKNIRISSSKNNKDFLALADIVKNTFVEKASLNFSNNPLSAARQLIDHSVSVSRKATDGSDGGFEIEVDKTNTDFNRTDDTTMEQLSTMFHGGIGCPPSIYNQLGENEYSRSIVTQHLMFSNIIGGLQDILVELASKEVRMYITYCCKFMEYLRQLIKEDPRFIVQNKEHLKRTKVDKDEGKVPDAEITEKSNKAEHLKDEDVDTTFLDEVLQDVINNLVVKLPHPRTVGDKAKFEEVETVMGALDNLINNIYSEEMVSDTDLKDTLSACKAYIKSNVVKAYAENLGLKNSFDMPAMEDVNFENINKLAQMLTHLKKGIDDSKKVLSGNKEDGGDSYY